MAPPRTMESTEKLADSPAMSPSTLPPEETRELMERQAMEES